MATEAKEEIAVPTFAADEVAKHSTERDCWIILHGSVYDVSPFLSDHPGGPEAVTEYAGKNSSVLVCAVLTASKP